jgi:4-hydroxyphenylpyruvate dioxygenase-like putative hemolysin
MQPLDGYSIYNEFIEKHGYGLQHVKFYYSDCAKAVEEYRKKGYEVIQSGRIGEDEFYYLESVDKVGAVLELGNAGEIPPPIRTYPPQQ